MYALLRVTRQASGSGQQSPNADGLQNCQTGTDRDGTLIRYVIWIKIPDWSLPGSLRPCIVTRVIIVVVMFGMVLKVHIVAEGATAVRSRKRACSSLPIHTWSKNDRYSLRLSMAKDRRAAVVWLNDGN
jgi:hypothetical protein